MRTDDIYSLPPNLPVPIDDGACAQLEGSPIPPIKFRSTAGGFRDLHAEFAALGVQVFGLSTQPTAYQREAAERLHLPFPLLSDEQLELTHGWGLPTFVFDGEVLLKRVTFVLRDGSV